MKKSVGLLSSILILGFFSAIFFPSCSTKCTQTRTYIKNVPVYRALSDIRASFSVESAQALVMPGKIHTKGDYLYIVEQRKGVHVVDNSNPSSPQFLHFIRAEECTDINSFDQVLYINQGPDIITVNIQNINDIRLVNRQKSIMNTDLIKADSFVVDYVEQEVVEIIEDANCGGGGFRGGVMFEDAASPSINSGNGSTGLSGSMARFSIIDGFLYIIDNSSLSSFQLSDPESPKLKNKQTVGTGMETIFGHKDLLFIGSQTGMLIMRSNGGNPVFISNFNHARGCDPVIVKDQTAYVTLRGNGSCGQTDNVLLVINIQNLTNPTLLQSISMNEPYGLGMNNTVLAVCDGASGLRLFDNQTTPNFLNNELTRIQGMKTYDVIMWQDHLVLTAQEGIFQYDISTPDTPIKLSTLYAK